MCSAVGDRGAATMLENKMCPAVAGLRDEWQDGRHPQRHLIIIILPAHPSSTTRTHFARHPVMTTRSASREAGVLDSHDVGQGAESVEHTGRR